MSYIIKNLSSNEKYISEIPLSRWGLFIPILLIIPIMTIPFSLYFIIRFYTIEQAITDKKVIKKSGIIGISTDEMRLAKIETVEIRQGVIGRIFNFGHVVVSGTGSSLLILTHVRNPKKIKNQIDEMID